MTGPAGTDRRVAAWFVAVGCLAAAVHWAVAMLLVERAGWLPLGANVGGWAVALGVSFAGHHRLSFRGHGGPLGRAARRFVAISAAGFCVNEAAYAVLLRLSPQRYDVLLAAVLLAVAFVTYRLSRHWVFLRSAGRP